MTIGGDCEKGHLCALRREELRDANNHLQLLRPPDHPDPSRGSNHGICCSVGQHYRTSASVTSAATRTGLDDCSSKHTALAAIVASLEPNAYGPHPTTRYPDVGGRIWSIGSGRRAERCVGTTSFPSVTDSMDVVRFRARFGHFLLFGCPTLREHPKRIPAVFSLMPCNTA